MLRDKIIERQAKTNFNDEWHALKWVLSELDKMSCDNCVHNNSCDHCVWIISENELHDIAYCSDFEERE